MRCQKPRFNGENEISGKGLGGHSIKLQTIHRYKNGKEVTADARLKIFRDSKRSESYWMTLTIVKEQDAGEYEVRATNILGSVESKSIVTVISEYTWLSGKNSFWQQIPIFLRIG